MSHSDATPAPVISASSPPSLSLTGTVRIGDASQLHASALALVDEGGDVIVSCDEAEHADASVLQILLALKEALRHEGRALRFTGVPLPLESFWRLTGVGSTLLE